MSEQGRHSCSGTQAANRFEYGIPGILPNSQPVCGHGSLPAEAVLWQAVE